MQVTIYFAIVICLAYALSCLARPGNTNSVKSNEVRDAPVKYGKGKAGKGKHFGKCRTDAQCPPGTVCSQASSVKGVNRARKCYPSPGICESSPCLNNGTCIDNNNGTFTCICENGFTGANCSEEQPCPSGWLLYRESCYFFSEDGKTWDESRVDCIDKGGYLVEIDSLGEFFFVYFYQVDYSSLWIGLSDIDKEGQYAWTRPESELSFSTFNFGSGTQNSNDYDCGFMYKGYGYWYFYLCSGVTNYACEKDAK